MSAEEWRVSVGPGPSADRYKKLALTRNPFSASGLAPENPLGLPLSAVQAELENFVVGFLTTGQYQAAVLIGDYGSGKTHHLRLLEQLFRKDPVTRVVYLSSAQREPRQVIEAVLQEIGTGDLAKLVWKPIMAGLRELNAQGDQALLQALGNEKLRQATSGNAATLFPIRTFFESSLADYREFLEEFTKRREFSLKMLRQFAIKTLGQHLQISAPAAIALFDTTDDEALRSASAIDALFARPSRTSEPKEAEILFGLSKLLDEDGTHRLVVLIDEFEGVSMLERMTHKQSVDYLYALRMLIDETANRASYALVIATTPTAYDKMVQDLYSATKGRFQFTIRLPVLDRDTAREILSKTLAGARVPEAQNGGISPFTDEFLEAALGQNKLTPRTLTIIAHRAIEMAAADAQATSITEQLLPSIGA